MNKNEDVEEVALQYADTIKIRNIQAAQRKENDPDGSGLNYLQTFSFIEEQRKYQRSISP